MPTYSAVLVIPADLKPQADAVGEAMGWGPCNYSIPIPDESRPTHYALRADVGLDFVRLIKGQDPLPDPALQVVIDALIADFSPDPDDADKPALWGREHLDHVIAKYFNIIEDE
jgi:hypothetical protein